MSNTKYRLFTRDQTDMKQSCFARTPVLLQQWNIWAQIGLLLKISIIRKESLYYFLLIFFQ